MNIVLNVNVGECFIVSIGIRSGRIWGISKRKLIEALGEYYSSDNPTHIFDITNQPIMTNKIIMNRKLDGFKIPHPKTYYYPFDGLLDSNQRCVIKPEYGSRGKGISFSRFNKIKPRSIPPNMYIQYYVPFEREFRIGIDFNRILGIREKLGIARIRNSKSCYYETRDIPKLKKFAWKVFKKFDVEFTGIDIGLWNGKYIVIELNSSPTIGTYWARLLAEDLIERYES